MQHHSVKKLLDLIETISIAPDELEMIRRQIKAIEKETVKQNFMINRTIKDKEIAINLLNTSVENLEDANRLLSNQNEEIIQINAELKHQKHLLEDTAKKTKQALRDLTHSYEALEQFSYIASHDLKTPLRSIAGYAQLLQRRYVGQLDSSADEFIGFIVNGIKNMNDIICDLLEYSRTSIKNQPKAVTDFGIVLKKVEVNLRDEIAQCGASLGVGLLPTLTVFDSSIQQLFQNLIGNALKFRRHDTPVKIEVQSERLADAWQFNVSDNGIGIDAAYHHKIFQPYQRLHTELPGMGMGLAICKKIVQMHHGDFWVKSILGEGSTFYFTIPD